MFWKYAANLQVSIRCGSVTSTKLESNFLEFALLHGCSPVHLLHIFRAPFNNNTSGEILLNQWLWLLIFTNTRAFFSVTKVAAYWDLAVFSNRCISKISIVNSVLWLSNHLYNFWSQKQNSKKNAVSWYIYITVFQIRLCLNTSLYSGYVPYNFYLRFVRHEFPLN